MSYLLSISCSTSAAAVEAMTKIPKALENISITNQKLCSDQAVKPNQDWFQSDVTVHTNTGVRPDQLRPAGEEGSHQFR